jgi:hypothetical protein
MLQSLRTFGAFLPTSLSGLGADPATVAALAAAITKMEGTIPPGPGYPNGSLAWQNNNPGNIRMVVGGYNYPGCTPGAGGFCAYPDQSTGQAALAHQIGVQVDKGQNLTQFFNQYAPASENNTANYIATVAAQTGIDPNVPLNGATVATTYDASSSGVQDPSAPASASAFDITDPTTWDTTEFAAVGIFAATVLYLLVSE